MLKWKVKQTIPDENEIICLGRLPIYNIGVDKERVGVVRAGKPYHLRRRINACYDKPLFYEAPNKSAAGPASHIKRFAAIWYKCQSPVHLR